MTAELATPPRRTTRWTGRASQHRRQQVGAHGSPAAARVHEVWAGVVEVLDDVPGHAGAALCTVDGTTVATYGLSRAEQLSLPREARRLLAAGTTTAPGVVSVEQVTGARCTVVARIPLPGLGDHLLVVTALGVSAPLLHAWTTRSALDLRDLLGG